MLKKGSTGGGHHPPAWAWLRHSLTFCVEPLELLLELADEVADGRADGSQVQVGVDADRRPIRGLRRRRQRCQLLLGGWGARRKVGWRGNGLGTQGFGDAEKHGFCQADAEWGVCFNAAAVCLPDKSNICEPHSSLQRRSTWGISPTADPFHAFNTSTGPQLFFPINAGIFPFESRILTRTEPWSLGRTQPSDLHLCATRVKVRGC